MLDNLLDAFDPEESANSSFDNYHAKGLTYLNLARSRQFTAKLYLSEPGIRHANSGFLVNPHSHRNNFETLIVRGLVEHFTFVEAESDAIEHESWCRFKFRSIVNGGKGFEYDQLVRLGCNKDIFHNGQTYYLMTHQIHTIRVSEKMPTVQFQIQYHDVPNPVTFCYSRATNSPSVEGLYDRMTPERALEVFKRIKELI